MKRICARGLRARLHTVPVLAGAVCCLVAVSCADNPGSVPAVTATAAAVAAPSVDQKGSADVSVDATGVKVEFDGSHGTLITVGITATATRTARLQASLFDSKGNPIGIASSDLLHLASGDHQSVTLHGQPPTGTIAHISFELVPGA